MALAVADRRRSTRKRVRLEAQYDSKSMELSTQVLCISRSGLFLSSDYLDDMGSMVALSLQLPAEVDPVRVAGRVVRVETSARGPGMGILFTDLSWRSRLSITRFVEDTDTRHLS